MKRVKAVDSPENLPPIRKARSKENRESQMIALAMDLVEKRLREGTATSQETVHFLRLGSLREQLEREKLEHENRMLEAKRAALEAQKVYSGYREDDSNQDLY